MPTINPAATPCRALEAGSPTLPGLVIALGAAAVRRVWLLGAAVLVADRTAEE